MSLFAIEGPIDYYCVIGNPIAHSKSPAIHAAFARQTGQALRYERVLVPLDGLDQALTEFRAQGGRGMNVTLPFKEAAFRFAGDGTPRAQLARAANTLWLDDRRDWHADNTDGAGLVRDLGANYGFDFAGRAVLLCGAGGAACGVLPALLERRPARVVIANRTLPRAEDLAQRMRGYFVAEVRACDYVALAGQAFDLIVNGTSLGLSGAVPPVPPECVAPETWCYDMLYGNSPTAFQRWAQARGARRALDGLGMLVEQAAESFHIWRGVRPDTAPVIAGLRNGTIGAAAPIRG